MLQMVAALVSVAMAAGAIALIAKVLAEDWKAIMQALHPGRAIGQVASPSPVRTANRLPRAPRVSPLSFPPVPQRAAA